MPEGPTPNFPLENLERSGLTQIEETRMVADKERGNEKRRMRDERWRTTF